MRTEEWFKKIFDRYYDPVRNYLYYLSGDIHWSDDAVQDLFMLVWERKDDLKEETIGPYMFKSAKNLFLKLKRHGTVHLKFEKSVPEGEQAVQSDEPLEKEEFDRLLQEGISRLPEKCRTVFLMSRLDEMSNRQIADNLNVTVKAVEKQITKALKLLRMDLEES